MTVALFLAVPVLAAIVLLVWVNRGNRGRFRQDTNAIDDYYAGRQAHRPFDPADRGHRRP